MSSARWSIMPSLSARCSIGVAVIAFLAGVLALQRCAQLPAAEWGWLGLVIVLLGWRYPVWQAPAWTAAGFWWAWWIAAAILAQELPAELEGKDLIAEGVIASLPAINDARSRFEFALERLGDGDHDQTHPDRIQLSWYGRERPVLRAGERWRFTVRRARLRWPRPALRWPAPKAAAVAARAAAAIYSGLAGFSVPTQRALIMITAVMVAVLRQRATRPFQILAVALLLVLIWDPLAVMEAGFWLSFAAVAVIFYGMGARLGARGLWWHLGRTQLLVAVGLQPLLLMLFQRVSLVSPLAILVAVPWGSCVTVPVSLSGAALAPWWPAAATLVLALADVTLAWLWPLLQWLTDSGFAQWSQPAPPAWTLLPAAAGALLLLAPAGVPGRWIGLILLMPLMVVAPVQPPPGEAWLTLLDVGQGLSAVIRTADHSLVFDTGPAFSASFDAGAAAVAPYLRAVGVGRVDTVIVSHGDHDLIGGFKSLVKQVSMDAVLSGVPAKVTPLAAQVQDCHAGQRWQWDGVDFEIIYPIPELATRGNDASCVLRVSTPGAVMLLPGDIEKRSEKALLAAAPALLRADVLVAPHHGSNTSSTAPFLDAVRPHYALFAVGYRNRYGFPKSQVVERYRSLDAQLLDTAAEGAITVRLGAGGVSEPER